MGVEESTSLSMRMLTPSISLAKGAEDDKLERFSCGCVGAAFVWQRLRIKRRATSARIVDLRNIFRPYNTFSDCFLLQRIVNGVCVRKNGRKK